MNLKIILGIVLPLAVILTLTVLSNSDIGLSIDFKPVDSITFSDLFTQNSRDYGRIVLANLNIKNDFFLSRNVEIDKYRVCFYSTKDGTFGDRELYLYYAPGGSSNYYGGDIFSGGYSPNAANNIQVDRKSQVDAELYAQKIYDYQGEQKGYYINYDKILLFKGKKNSYEYDFCSKLSKEDVKNAASIDVKERSFQVTNTVNQKEIPPRPLVTVPEKVKVFE